MTTRRTAQALLFSLPLLNKGSPEKVAIIDRSAPMTTSPSATRRRVKPLYCTSCGAWVNVELQPVRLRCSGCGVETRP